MKKNFAAWVFVGISVLCPLWVQPAAMAAGPAATVEMNDEMRFVPDRITIRPGDSVEWKNVSRQVHTVTADPKWATSPQNVQLPDGAGPFDSGDIPPGKTYRRDFTVPGTYRYFCIPHQASGMIGEITVKP
ncbi:MAG TPA: plastocyanin/azurin family copper-binding protein [Thermodesulfobacteriota bacterium]|nr:plastocyanin/azurin family copper-binding protein [Thermodesulfobacteriota bacterium]